MSQNVGLKYPLFGSIRCLRVGLQYTRDIQCCVVFSAAKKKEGGITVVSKLADQSTAEGATVKFECKITGATTYKW